MSDFQYVLSPAQLTKHYEVIQFLTQHPNQEYTLAQLDTLLPHGVAVQRFPEEWFDLIEDGACWHRSIELRRPDPSTNASGRGGDGDVASGLEAAVASTQSRAARRAAYRLLCLRSEIRTLDELRARLESPTTLLDADGCVALHTDQIIIAPELILRAQRTGLVYYFPDTYDKSEYRQFGIRDTVAATPADGEKDSASLNSSTSRANVGQATAALLDMFAHEEERSNGKANTSLLSRGSRHRTYISLPPGVRVRHQLLTRRGVPEQEDLCLPRKLYVGERLRLTFDNAVAVQKLHMKNKLQVQFRVAGVRASRLETSISGGVKTDVLLSEPPPPLQVRQETQAVRHAASAATPTASVAARAAFSAAGPSSSPPSGNNSSAVRGSEDVASPSVMGPPSPLLLSATTKVEIAALYACRLTLILTVNGVENVLAMEVMEESTSLPGVLILRDRQLDSFVLPQRDLLADPLVNPPLELHYPYQAILSNAASASPSAPDSAVAALENQPWSELVPLPWAQNPSPVVMSLREVTYPTQHATVQAATRAVFSAQSLADEARLRQTKDRLRREAERQAGAGAKRRRVRYRSNMILSNRHLLHFGLDFSIPFSRQPK